VDRARHAESISTSVDLPLSKASRSVLAQAEKERMRVGVANLGPEHIFLGLLRQKSLAAEILRERGLKLESVRERLEKQVPPQPVRKGKRTACKDCKHLIVADELDQERLNLFCAASPIKPEFDCYTGEFRHVGTHRPSDQYRPCIMVNFGECGLFEPKQESPEPTPSA
jgi:hypothetical protein